MTVRELDYGNVSRMLTEARAMQTNGKYINGTVFHTLADEVDRLSHLHDLWCEWRNARRAFLALLPNSPDARAALNRLANAEAALMKGTDQ